MGRPQGFALNFIRSFPGRFHHISLILQPDGDDTNLAPLCVISMHKSDFKMYTKILANSLNKCIKSLVHMDQTGFIPNRYSFLTLEGCLI